MNKEIRAVFRALAIGLAMIVFVCGSDKSAPAAEAASDALSALPPSDLIVFVDAQRMLSEVLPRVFSSNPTLRDQINTQLDQFKTISGLDPRAFDQLTLGISFSTTTGERLVALAHGSHIDANQVIAAALSEAAKRRAQTAHPLPAPEPEGYQGKTVYVLDGTMENGIVASVLDANTIAIGDFKGVRAAIDVNVGRMRHVDDELIALATRESGVIIGFSGRVPPPAIAPGESSGSGTHDSFVHELAFIRQFYGSFNVEQTNAEILLVLRAENEERARQIGERLQMLKQLLVGALTQEPIPTGAGTAAQEKQARSSETGAAQRDDKMEATDPHQSIALPGLGLIVAAPVVRTFEKTEVTVEGTDILLKLKRPLADLMPHAR